MGSMKLRIIGKIEINSWQQKNCINSNKNLFGHLLRHSQSWFAFKANTNDIVESGIAIKKHKGGSKLNLWSKVSKEEILRVPGKWISKNLNVCKTALDVKEQMQ